MPKATVGRWGSSLAVRLPTELAAALDLREGERIEMDSSADRIVIRKARPHYTLEAMFAGETDEHWRALYADGFDWGPDVGQEVVPE